MQQVLWVLNWAEWHVHISSLGPASSPQLSPASDLHPTSNTYDIDIKCSQQALPERFCDHMQISKAEGTSRDASLHHLEHHSVVSYCNDLGDNPVGDIRSQA